MLRKLLALVTLVTALTVLIPASLAVDAAAAERSYVFATLDFPRASKTFAMGNNADGDIVGYYIADNQTHGFLLSRGTLTTLDYPGTDAVATQANAINDAGDIVGTYSLKSGPAGNVHGFLRTRNGDWSTVDYPEGTHLMAGGGFGIGADRTIFGCFHDGSPISAMYGYSLGSQGASSFDYPAGAPFAMHYGATPDGKTIVGAYLAGKNQPDNWHAYILNDGNVISFDVPGKLSTWALGIGPARDVVGTYKVQVGSAWNQHGYVAETRGSMNPADWTFTMVDVPNATQTIVRGINAAGDLVGTYIDASGGTHGFMTRPGQPKAGGNEGGPSPAPAPPSAGTGLADHGSQPWRLAGALALILAGAATAVGVRRGRRGAAG